MMEGILSFVFFAIFFYVMMRFGCGAHMTHGHHANPKDLQFEHVFDPVCNMKVGDEEGYGKLHNGELFRFCSKKCLDKFDRDPEKYISQSNSTTTKGVSR